MAKEFKIAGEKVSPAWNVEILARSLSEKELKSLWETYKNARLTSGTANTPPTDRQKEIAAYAKKTKHKNGVIAVKFKIKDFQVRSAIQKVAVYAYIND